MSTLDDLLLQQADILEKIKIARSNGKADALAHVLKLIEDYDITLDELNFKPRSPKIRKNINDVAVKSNIPGSKKRGRPRKIQVENQV